MIKIDKQAIAAFRAQLKLERARLDLEITQAFQAWTVRIFRQLVEGSPQWSGNLAANWNYSVGFPSDEYSRIPNKTGDAEYGPKGFFHPDTSQGVYQMGHPLAVNLAMLRMQSQVKGTWRDLVFLTNNTPMDDSADYLVDAIQKGDVKLRTVNAAYLLIDRVVSMESQRTTP